MEDQDQEYNKLPVEERCVHKAWKARSGGYDEAAKLFRQMDDEKSPEFAKYLGLVKKFVVDSNAVAQEKGLEATLAYVENYAHAGKTVQDVMSGIVAKCIAAPRTKTRELALQLTLMYIEIEKQEAVQDELLKGADLKNPKIVSACVNASTTALREFGTKIVSVKPLLKKIGALLSDRDKGVRDETKLMIVEMYRWIGGALRPQLMAANLQPVQMTELEGEFSKIEGQKATPTRYVRSQQSKQAQLAAVVTSQSEDVETDETDVPQEIDPFELADPVEILSKIPKDFYEKIEAKKWQERKEVLEALETLVKAPKLENGDYGDLVRALKKVIQKDNNVVCVALAGRCLAGLTNGLKKKFQQYSGFCIPALLEKFKEKKQNVVAAIREAIDAIYLTTNIEAILEDVLEALNSKNPSVRVETQAFLSRAFTKTLPTAVNKKTLKALTTALIKNINESDPSVRETSAETLGTLMKLVGEKAIGPFFIELEKDTLKMSKIKEHFEKTVITVRLPVKKERPVTAPPPAKVTAAPARKPAPKRTAPLKKKTEISSGSATVVRSKGKPPSQVIERELSNEEADEIITGLFDATITTDIVSANWKARVAAAEQILTQLQSMESSTVPTQAVVKFLSKKPGLKDTNFQALKAKLDIMKYLAENCKFTLTTANCCVADISEKFSDSKNNVTVAETLTAICEATSFGEITDMVLDFSFNQKSPKVQQEALTWLSGAMKEFGFNNLNVKFLIDTSKKALASTNPTVRQSAITLLGVMHLYMGASIYVFFETEKQALRDMISAECEKYQGETAPTPTRGVSKSASSDSLDIVGDEAPEPINIQDLMPRVDISSQITESLLNELADKKWTVRNETLTKITQIIQEAKFIKPNLGDLPQALATRLTDSNVKIAQTTLNVCEAIAKAMGAPCKQCIKVFFPGFLQSLGDSKVVMRTTSMDTINVFAEQCGYKEFFENEMVGDALKTGSPALRIELWSWLAQVLPKVPLKSIPKEELVVCLPYLYSNLEDRNAEVRKNAQEAILGIMIHLGYESMVKQCEKLKPSSKTGVLAALDKVRPNLPAKPTVKKASDKEDKTVRGTKPVATSKNAVKPKGVATSKSSTTLSSRKKDDDLDMSPLLVVNNSKQQRSLDEAKLKVLKWNFTQPREEFVELLRDQMTCANVNKTLMGNMFHSDFKYHIKAIESLYEDLSDNKHALISNLDLILKWLTLRFFDTNPSVLLKGLEYLHAVFNMLIDEKYRMSEAEASSFVPYLVLKIGDPKDSVRNGVKSLLNQMNRLHPVGKMFFYVMEGIKSKNARQRAECLEVMGSIIEESGIGVCVPTPAACLKEVAKQISDRDNSVRNAALNCILQAYNLVGDKVYKFVGNISDKDMSLLEERIKRSSRRSVMPKQDVNATIVMLPTSPQREAPKPSTYTAPPIPEPEPQYDQDDDVQEDNFPPFALPRQIPEESPKEIIDGPFKLDEEFMRDLERKMPKPLVWPQLKVTDKDLEFLKEPIYIPTISEAREQVMARGRVPWRTAFVSIKDTKSRLRLSANATSPRKSDLTIERLIKQMAATSTSLAIGAMLQLEEMMPGPKGNILNQYEDEFMVSITTQLKFLALQDVMTDSTVAKCYKNILSVVDAFYKNTFLGTRLSIAVIKDLMDQFISLLVEEKLVNIPNGEYYIRVINLHCVKIIERSEHTHAICAHIQLINECISNGSSARKIDLVMKCLWRIIKLMPTWGDEIDYDLVLLEVHNFMKKFPSSWWKSKEVDTPLRTVKTILHSSAKIKGGTIMLHLGKIPNTSESEVESYILRVLRGLKITDIQQLPSKQATTRANHSTLTDIFQKIGIKEEAKEGLNLLYNFIQEHPETDIEPFLKDANKFFQDYIKNGLKEIEESRRPPKQSSVTEWVCNEGGDPETFVIQPDPRKPVEYYRQRLDMWSKLFEQALAGKKVVIPKIDV